MSIRWQFAKIKNNADERWKITRFHFQPKLYFYLYVDSIYNNPLYYNEINGEFDFATDSKKKRR